MDNKLYEAAYLSIINDLNKQSKNDILFENYSKSYKKVKPTLIYEQEDQEDQEEQEENKDQEEQSTKNSGSSDSSSSISIYSPKNGDNTLNKFKNNVKKMPEENEIDTIENHDDKQNVSYFYKNLSNKVKDKKYLIIINKNQYIYNNNTLYKLQSKESQNEIKEDFKLVDPSQYKNYNEDTKKLIENIKHVEKTYKDKFHNLKKDHEKLYNNLVFAIGVNNDAKHDEDIINYTEEDINITKEQYEKLKSMCEEISKILSLGDMEKITPEEIEQAYKNLSPEEINKYIKNMPDPVKKECKALGFRTKKQAAGFMAMFEQMFDKIFSMFNGENTQKKAANDTEIQRAMPDIINAIKENHIKAGTYPVYFDKNQSIAEAFRNMTK